MWDGNHFRANQTNGPSMRNEVPSSTNPVFTFNNDTDTGMSRADNNKLSLITAGVEAIRIDASQNVGIGTTAPEGVLHTANNSGVNIFQRSNDSASYGTNLYVRKSRGTVGSESNTQSGDLIGQMAFSPYYGDYDNYAASISSAIEGTVTTDTTPGRLMFSTAAAGANTVTERMRIDSAGKVGIGTSSPDKTLHVVGTTRLHGAAIIGVGNNADDITCRFIQGRAASGDGLGDLYLQYGNANRVYVGNSSGESDLRLYGDFQIYNGSTNWLTVDTSATQLDVTGDVNVTGTISATAKSFNIPHPLYKDKRLVHGSLEGPEHAIYVRGTIETEEKGCLVELPEYWSAMCEDYTVQLTPHGPYTVYIKEKLKDKVMIECSQKKFKFDYYIVGARTDETLEVVQDA
jgi:hypothetical protein